MSDVPFFNPRPKLQTLINEDVRIKLKWGELELTGTLVSFDLYMNFLLKDAKEYVDGVLSGTLGQVFIRCNNVLWIGKDLESQGDKDTGAEAGGDGASERTTGEDGDTEMRD